MIRPGTRALALLLAVGWLTMHSAVASGATTEIGAVGEIRAGQPPSAITVGGHAVQVAEATGTYAVPAGYGTITAWHHSAGGVAGSVTFKVYRPTGALREFVVVGSDTRTVAPRAVQTFPVHIPVLPGDRIGLSSEEVELAYESFSPADRIGFFSFELPLGATRTTDGEPFQEFKLDVSATLLTTDPQAAAPGTSPGAGSPDALVRGPSLERLSVAPSRFRAARTGPSTRRGRPRSGGARVSYRARAAAGVRFTVHRVRPGRREGSRGTGRCVSVTRSNRRRSTCTRYIPVKGAFSRSARAGVNSFYLTGRLGARTLSPGLYRLSATPKAGGRTGRRVSRSFRIVRGPAAGAARAGSRSR